MRLKFFAPMMLLICANYSWAAAVLNFSEQTATAVDKSWEFATENDGVKVWTKDVAGSPIKAFMGKAILDEPAEKLLALFEDVEKAPLWLDRCTAAKTIQALNKNDIYLYAEMSMPWPVQDRDAAIHRVINKDDKTGTYTIDLSVAPKGIMAIKNDFVRIPEMSSKAILRSIGPNQVEVTIMGHADPGGAIPKWFLNLIVTEMPLRSFDKLKDIIAQTVTTSP